MPKVPLDQFSRPLHHLRVSVTDRCNFRCRYCMPVEHFGPDYSFLPRADILTFEEIVRIVQAMQPLGVDAIRLTGGEPLLRRGIADLVALISSTGIKDLSLTTNGVLLAHRAEQLALAGLNRITVSLDALDPELFAKMNGVGAKVDRVLTGINAAQTFGLPVKVNCVVQKGVNESQIIPMVRWARDHDITLRFIEYMDVGESNGWDHTHVVSQAEILAELSREFDLVPLEPNHTAETAKRWKHADSEHEIGIISSVTKPFCQGCSRLRLSADGKLFTCLFTDQGHDIREDLRASRDDEALRLKIFNLWSKRTDRYSELRGEAGNPTPGTPGTSGKAEMSYLGG